MTEKASQLEKVNLKFQNTFVSACRGGDIRYAKKLMKRGASFTEPNKDGLTPLQAACRNLSFSVIKWLDQSSAREDANEMWCKVRRDPKIWVPDYKIQVPEPLNPAIWNKKEVEDIFAWSLKNNLYKIDPRNSSFELSSKVGISFWSLISINRELRNRNQKAYHNFITKQGYDGHKLKKIATMTSTKKNEELSKAELRDYKLIIVECNNYIQRCNSSSKIKVVNFIYDRLYTLGLLEIPQDT